MVFDLQGNGFFIFLFSAETSPSNKKKTIDTPRKINRWITWEYTFTPLQKENHLNQTIIFSLEPVCPLCFSLDPSKIRSFPIKTVVIWVRFGGCKNSIVFCWISPVFRVRRFHLKKVIAFWLGEDGCLSNKGSKGCLLIPALHPRTLTNWYQKLPCLKGVTYFPNHRRLCMTQGS